MLCRMSKTASITWKLDPGLKDQIARAAHEAHTTVSDFLDQAARSALASSGRTVSDVSDELKARILAAGGTVADIASHEAMQDWLTRDGMSRIGTYDSGDPTGSETVKRDVRQSIIKKIERQRRENPGPD